MLALLLFVPPVAAPPVAALDVCYPSGFHLRVEEDHRLPEVSVSTFIEGGSTLPGATGTAHLLEHLWFRGDHGAQDRPAAEQHACGPAVHDIMSGLEQRFGAAAEELVSGLRGYE